ncbi:MAG: SDR family oxidoreductase [Planctomycetes bacterium]|nr:SDR family oxidoreductase [Planctomycetota bacterium]
MFTLKDKNALVCGSSHGIGQACAQEIAKLGASVTLLARGEAGLKEALAGLSVEAGQTHGYLCADSADPEALQAVVTKHLQSVGTIHILVNNTGGPPSGPLLDAEPEQLLSGFRNHVLCNQLLVRTVVSGMKACGFGRIVNIISTSVVMPIGGLGVSNTTRGAMANWGRTLAGELAPFGITVNNILPGYTDTGRLESLFAKKSERTGVPAEEIRRQVIESIPMKRLGEPKEIGAVVAFLVTPAAAYVNGVNLPVDGGRTAVQ